MSVVFSMSLITGVRCAHRVRLALQTPVALQKALFAVLVRVGKVMGYRASYPEYGEAEYLVEIHSSGDGGRRAGIIVAAVGAVIFAVVLPRRPVLRWYRLESPGTPYFWRTGGGVCVSCCRDNLRVGRRRFQQRRCVLASASMRKTR